MLSATFAVPAASADPEAGGTVDRLPRRTTMPRLPAALRNPALYAAAVLVYLGGARIVRVINGTRVAQSFVSQKLCGAWLGKSTESPSD